LFSNDTKKFFWEIKIYLKKVFFNDEGRVKLSHKSLFCATGREIASSFASFGLRDGIARLAKVLAMCGGRWSYFVPLFGAKMFVDGFLITDSGLTIVLKSKTKMRYRSVKKMQQSGTRTIPFSSVAFFLKRTERINCMTLSLSTALLLFKISFNLFTIVALTLI